MLESYKACCCDERCESVETSQTPIAYSVYGFELRSPVLSIRGKANRHPSARVLGSHFVLDDGRSRKQAARFQDLLQQPSHAYLPGRANAGYARVTTSSQSPLV